MSGNIYFSTPASAPTPPTPIATDIYLENVLQGQVSNLAPIYVELEDGGGAPITPTSSSLVGNTLTAVLPTPAPSGVALRFPVPTIRLSSFNYDTGWRLQNGFYAYTPPVYPAAYAELDYTAGANFWYRLRTPLRVNGVLSTQRFVDLSGVQGWTALNNLNFAVLDKLTGIMVTRIPTALSTGIATYQNYLSTLNSLSVTINGNVYSQWFGIGVPEAIAFFGNMATSTNWIDPSSGLSIMPNGIPVRTALSQLNQNIGFLYTSISGQTAGCDFSALNPNDAANQVYAFKFVPQLITT